MNIVDIIFENIALLTNPFTSFHGDKSEFNLKMDDVSGDMAWLAYPIISPIRMTKGGAFEPTRPIEIFFCRKTDMGDPTKDSTASVDHTTVCYDMELICYKMLTLLQNDSRIREVFDVRIMQLKNETDTNLTGCVLAVKLRQTLGVSVC